MVRCRPETLAFTSTAPVRAHAVRELPASPDRVFDVLADAPGWADWFPGLREARWTSEETHRVGATRTVVVGPLRVDEEFIVWEPAQRFGFTFTGSNLPLSRAGVELAELVELPHGRTRLTYTFAIEPLGVPAVIARATAPGIGLALGRGLAGLDRHLRTTT